VVGVIRSNQGICLLIARVFGDDDNGQSSAFIDQGVEWCAQNGARVINMSLGAPSPNTPSRLLMEQLVQKENILVVASAGNNGDSSYSYPASYPDVISVAAVDEFWFRAGFSQYNDQVDVAAPGVRILSTVPGNQYEFLQGTSMASPHVAGACAKLWAARPQCTNQQIRKAVESTAIVKWYGGKNVETGNGVVQIKDAYEV
jgi:serine protease